MNITIITAKQSYTDHAAQCLGVGMFEDEDPDKLPEDLPPYVVKELKSLAAKKKFTGKLKEKKGFTLHDAERSLVMVGLGKKEEYSLERMRKAAARIVKAAEGMKASSVAFNLHLDALPRTSLEEKAQECTVAALLSLYRFEEYKTEGKEEEQVKRIVLFADKDAAAIERGIARGKVIAEAVDKARDLGNIPANILDPAYLEAYARKIAKDNKLSFQVLGKKELEKKGMNLILAVGKASAVPPRMIKLEYAPKKKTRETKRIVLVGKGITFDTGGLNIKPGQWMDYMKSDMCGAADVLQVMDSARKLGCQHQLIGIIAAAENSISGPAMRPGDVVKGYGGKTVEILNTDAEGRLVLADAVAWAEDFKPDIIVDIATLTGAAIGHLGYEGSPVVGTDEKGLRILEEAGLYTYERIWKMPIWEEFEEIIKSDIADIRNLSKPKGIEAGVITGGLFMKQFIKKTPWIHIDIGNMSWFPEAKDYFPRQASGWGVRLLLRFIETYR